MLEESGVVITVDASTCLVELGVSSACGACQTPCSSGHTTATRRLNLRTPNDLVLQPGDRVLVGVSAGRALWAASAFYLGSVLALLLGAGICASGSRFFRAWDGDMAAVGGAAVFFLAYVAAMKKWGWIESLAAVPTIRERLDT